MKLKTIEQQSLEKTLQGDKCFKDNKYIVIYLKIPESLRRFLRNNFGTNLYKDSKPHY